MNKPKRSSLGPTAALAVVAIVVAGAVILFAGRRGTDQDAGAGPSASVTAAAVATSSLTHTFTPASLSPTAAAAGARPDAAHGVITFENLRTEDETYTGRGATQDDGRLVVWFTNGAHETRMSGTLARLRVE